jgi:hypothetical protein
MDKFTTIIVGRSNVKTHNSLSKNKTSNSHFQTKAKILYMWNICKCLGKPKGQSRMDIPETLATLGTQDT